MNLILLMFLVKNLNSYVPKVLKIVAVAVQIKILSKSKIMGAAMEALLFLSWTLKIKGNLETLGFQSASMSQKIPKDQVQKVHRITARIIKESKTFLIFWRV